MQNITKSLLQVLTVLLVPFAISAKTGEAETGRSHDLPVYVVKGLTVLPELVKAPTPTASSKIAGAAMEFKFRINEWGKVERIRLDKTDTTTAPNEMVMAYADQLADSLKKWSFNPALDNNNNPVAVTVRLPINIKDGKKKGSVVLASSGIIIDRIDRS
ncbi:MAG: hypothetical protein KJT03_06180 [Verrucomicrobiae bacterium]|nr:hypothetical protein [Verrucomicrobiae bacterium]